MLLGFYAWTYLRFSNWLWVPFIYFKKIILEYLYLKKHCGKSPRILDVDLPEFNIETICCFG